MQKKRARPEAQRERRAVRPGALAPEQVQSFHDKGYLIVRDVFRPADLDPLRRELAQAIDEKVRALHAAGELSDLHADLDFDHRLTAIHRDKPANGEAIMKHLEGQRGGGFHAPALFAVIANDRLLDKVGALLGTDEIVGSSVYRLRPKLPNLGRGIVPWHQDSGYFAAACDRQLIITCWIPLVDANVANGCMQILPGAHRRGVATHHTGGNAGFLVIHDENLPDDPRRAITAECPRGGVVFMTNLTPHCSTPNTSDHIRWSIDLRYQSADVPNNIGLWPGEPDAAGFAPNEFYEKVNVACYPPEADFLVRSRRDPGAVTDYAEYVRGREAFERS
jgi:ectoine hydroxylase-related dioxygenase (phytanoyl-CoA dioxygenase family)